MRRSRGVAGREGRVLPLDRKEVEEMSYQRRRSDRFPSSFTVWVVMKAKR